MVMKMLFQSDRKLREQACLIGATHRVNSACRRGAWAFIVYFETDDPSEMGWFGCNSVSS